MGTWIRLRLRGRAMASIPLALAFAASPLSAQDRAPGESIRTMTVVKAAASGLLIGIAGMNGQMEGGVLGSDQATIGVFTTAGAVMALAGSAIEWHSTGGVGDAAGRRRAAGISLSFGGGYYSMGRARRSFEADPESRGTPSPAGTEWRLDLLGPVSPRADLGIAVSVLNLRGHEEVTSEVRSGGIFGPIYGDFVTSSLEASAATFAVQARRFLGDPGGGPYVSGLVGLGRARLESSLPGSDRAQGVGPLLELAFGTSLTAGRSWLLEVGARFHRIGTDGSGAGLSVDQLDFSGVYVRLGRRMGL